MWCTVWKGTAQDCVDHLRKTCREGGKFGPLFPPMDSYEKSAISGVVIDTLLFSRIGVPLFHHYRIISRAGTQEMDEETVRHHHHRRAKEMAARMSLSSVRDSAEGTADVSTQCTVTRQTVSRAQRPRKSVRGPGLLVPRTQFPYLQQKHTLSTR